jgi:hypothetical protein
MQNLPLMDKLISAKPYLPFQPYKQLGILFITTMKKIRSYLQEVWAARYKFWNFLALTPYMSIDDGHS